MVPKTGSGGFTSLGELKLPRCHPVLVPGGTSLENQMNPKRVYDSCTRIRIIVVGGGVRVSRQEMMYVFTEPLRAMYIHLGWPQHVQTTLKLQMQNKSQVFVARRCVAVVGGGARALFQLKRIGFWVWGDSSPTPCPGIVTGSSPILLPEKNASR